MDRRQKKTREAIFHAFSALLSKKRYHQITVGEIIETADIGRATFYAHFETKDFLLKALCEELFCHVFDATKAGGEQHRHIFSCDAPSSVTVHLLQHLQKMDTVLLSEKDTILKQYTLDCKTIGQDIVLVRGDEKRYGHALDIDADGGLIVKFESGEIETVNSGEVSVRGMYGYL
jgi:hypothetical protein